MDLLLAGQTAVVVGAARGIGRAIAAAFAHEGTRVAVIDRDHEVHQTARLLTSTTSVQVTSFVTDVMRYAELEENARIIKAALGRIDHVVFAVGIGSGKFGFPFWNLEPADWPRVLEVNVLGAVHVLHAFVPYLRDARFGSVSLLASVAGQIGSQTDPPYSASKAALINFGQCAAKDLAPYQVRVNVICPGMVKTELNRAVWEAWARQQAPDERKSYEEWAGEKVERVVPLGRWQEPEDIANMAVFLASERGKNITGQTINVDGGFVMHW
ncbi:MAG: SDR family oxidoreductase [Gemmataceae bacterium]